MRDFRFAGDYHEDYHGHNRDSEQYLDHYFGQTQSDKRARDRSDRSHERQRKRQAHVRKTALQRLVS